MQTRLCRFLTVPLDGYTIRFYPSAMSMRLWLEPRARHVDADVIRLHLRPGEVAVDVGANIGSTVMPASLAVGPSGVVYAIEAHPRIFSFLEGNLALNGAANVRAFNVALGDHEGTVRFADRGSDDQNAVSEDSGIEVPLRRLDDLVPGDAPVSFLKIDVEGYERFVLAGAERLLARTATVYFEASDALFGRYGYRCDDVLAFLRDRGFSIHRWDGERALHAIPGAYASDAVQNLLAVRSVPDFCSRTGFRPAA